MSYPWNKYPWARNKDKLERAFFQLEKAGKKFSEEDVRELYLRFGGAVVEIEKEKGKKKK